jgi:hypothetical protein
MSRITIQRKTDSAITVNFTNSVEDFVVGTYTVYLAVRETVPKTTVNDDDDAIISDSKTVVVSAPSDTMTATFNLSRTKTNINIKQYNYDIKLLTPDDKLYPVLYGEFVVTEDAVRRPE